MFRRDFLSLPGLSLLGGKKNPVPISDVPLIHPDAVAFKIPKFYELFKKKYPNGCWATNDVIHSLLDDGWHENLLTRDLGIPITGHFTNSRGDNIWLEKGEYHRLDGPAIFRENCFVRYYQNGKSFRKNGPCDINIIAESIAWSKNLCPCGSVLMIKSLSNKWYCNHCDVYFPEQDYPYYNSFLENFPTMASVLLGDTLAATASIASKAALGTIAVQVAIESEKQLSLTSEKETLSLE